MTKTAREVAEHMVAELEASGELSQSDVVWDIEQKFGEEFVYDNENGNRAIHKKVLAEFKKLTPNAVWERANRCWRLRQRSDDPGRRSQD